MDVLWQRQKHLHIILQTLSADCWIITDEVYVSGNKLWSPVLFTFKIQSITQTPTAGEWERFRRYAARVVDLVIGARDILQVDVSPEAMSFLEMKSGFDPLWPRVASLRLLVETTWDVARSTLASLSPSVTDLTLSLPRENSVLLQPILSNFSDGCHGVQSLTLDIVVGDSRSAHEVGG